ncbi:transporter substrate-binding domain-containing protein [Deltaproteobacteria bacterium TL4]
MSMKFMYLFGIISVVGIIVFISSLRAEEPLVVGVNPAPPFVIVEPGTNKLSGFSIDLIEAIAQTLTPPRNIRYDLSPDLLTHLESLRAQKVDLGIAATTITPKREEIYDFSHAFFQGNLAVLTKAEGDWKNALRMLFSPKLLELLLSLFIYLLICAHLIWFLERENSTFNKKWLPGIMEGIWWTVVTMSTVGYGDFVPKKTISRILGIFIIFTGIIFFGIAIAGMTSLFTVYQMNSRIEGISSLPGRKVGVIKGTLGAKSAEKRKTIVSTFESMDTAMEALKENKIEAILHDMPLIRYYIKDAGDQFVLIDRGFAVTGYGITFPSGSPLRESVNIALLTLMNSGQYETLKQKWFGHLN